MAANELKAWSSEASYQAKGLESEGGPGGDFESNKWGTGREGSEEK